jgi:hypothetical protein
MSLFPCLICRKTFANKSSVWRHCKIEHPNGTPHQCSKCPLSFENLHLLKRHVNEKHIGKLFTQCPNCPKKVRNLPLHLKQAHSQEGFACKICQKPFPSRSARNLHERSEHVTENDTVCPVCNLVFGNVLEHLKISHSGSCTFQCPQCNEYLPSMTSVDKHRLKVHYPPDLICIVCQKQSKKMKHYDAHYQPLHASIEEKLAYSRLPEERWLCKLYIFKTEDNTAFKVGITSQPLNYRLSKLKAEGHTLQLVHFWELPLLFNNRLNLVFQTENKIHLELSKRFEVVHKKYEYFKLSNSTLHEVTDLVASFLMQGDVTYPIRIVEESKSKLYLLYNEDDDIGKIGFTRLPMYKRLSHYNTGKHKNGKGLMRLIDLIFVDSLASVYELRAWENDILIRVSSSFSMVKREYFNCRKDELETARNLFLNKA